MPQPENMRPREPDEQRGLLQDAAAGTLGGLGVEGIKIGAQVVKDKITQKTPQQPPSDKA